MKRKANFQCPDTGLDCTAKYHFGKLFVKPDKGVQWDTYPEAREETVAWCLEHHGKKFKTMADAIDYLVDHIGGDAYQLEE